MGGDSKSYMQSQKSVGSWYNVLSQSELPSTPNLASEQTFSLIFFSS